MTPGRLASRASELQSGSTRRRTPGRTPARANRRCSRTASVISAPSGQARPAASARLRLSWTVLRAAPSIRPIARALTPSWASRSICRSWRMVSSLLAGIRSSSWLFEKRNAAVADPRETTSPKSATGWPASSRNDGRHQIGTMADITSEQVAGFHRNLHLSHCADAVFRRSGDLTADFGLKLA